MKTVDRRSGKCWKTSQIWVDLIFIIIFIIIILIVIIIIITIKKI